MSLTRRDRARCGGPAALAERQFDDLLEQRLHRLVGLQRKHLPLLARLWLDPDRDVDPGFARTLPRLCKPSLGFPRGYEASSVTLVSLVAALEGLALLSLPLASARSWRFLASCHRPSAG
jgi:hypothetical protein